MNSVRQTNIFQLLKIFWGFVSSFRKVELFCLVLLSFLVSVTEIVSIGALLPFLGALTNPEKVFSDVRFQFFVSAFNILEPSQLVAPIAVFFAIAAVVAGLMRVTLLWVLNRVSHGIGADISVDIYSKTLAQPYLVHAGRNTSDIISAISVKVNRIVYEVLVPVVTGVSSILMILVILAGLFFLDPFVASICILAFAMIYFLIIMATKEALRRHGAIINREQDKVIKSLQEGLGGIQDILLNGAQDYYCRMYQNSDLPLRRSQAIVQVISASPKFVIEALGLLFISLFALSLSRSAADIDNIVPMLGVLAIAAQRMLPLMQGIYSGWSSLNGAVSVLYDINTLLLQSVPELINSDVQILFSHRIQLQGISFRYPNRDFNALDGITFDIPKGSRIGIIGPTGCGKSTLLKIIMGLLSPTSGRITVDSTVINYKNMGAFQRKIAYVPQEIYLLDASVRENIAFGVPHSDIDDQRVENCASMAFVADVVESLSDKYNTHVGERGVSLSGGQRQRLGLARALYKNPQILVLDEATSALDQFTESQIIDCIKNLDKDITVITVAHRLSTIQNCDLVISLEKGTIIKIGPWNSILQQDK